MPIDPDATDVRASADGNQAALARLYDRYAVRVHGLAYRMLFDAGAAEDVTQETFMRVWDNAKNWDEKRASFATWLYRIATNLCIDRLRKRRELLTDSESEMIDSSAWANPSLALDRQQTQAQLRKAIAALPDRQRLALTLSLDRELSNADAGAVLNVSERAMESLLARARRNLRRTLADTHPALLGATQHEP